MSFGIDPALSVLALGGFMNITRDLQLQVVQEYATKRIYKRERNVFAYIFKSFSEEKVHACQSRIDDVKLATVNVFSVATFVK